VATLGTRVNDDLYNKVAAAAAAANMKVGAWLTATVEEKLSAGVTVNKRQLSLLNPTDKKRLGGQREQIRIVMVDGAWRSLPDLAAAIFAADSSIPSISARLRDLRKAKFGSYILDKREPRAGYFEYQLTGGAANAEV